MIISDQAREKMVSGTNALVTRLLCKRPLQFMCSYDSYLLRDGATGGTEGFEEIRAELMTHGEGGMLDVGIGKFWTARLSRSLSLGCLEAKFCK